VFIQVKKWAEDI